MTDAEQIDAEEQLTEARNVILDLEHRNGIMENLLADIADEIKVTAITACDCGKLDDSVNIPRRHWKMLEAFGIDARRVAEGKL